MCDRLSDFWYQTAYWTSAITMGLGFSLRTEGERNIPWTGPLLVIANHQSFLDPVLVGLAVRRPLTPLARQSLFRHRSFAWLIRSLRAVPVNQEGFAREGLVTILEQLKAERAVLIFPEGERTPDGSIMPLRPGIHLLLKRVAVPILPVGIAGAYEAWPRWRKYPIPSPLFLPVGRSTIAVSVGTPLDSRRWEGRPRAELLADLHLELRKAHQRAEQLRRKG